ncbi:MAG: helix-turn-helix domain-containing protein [Bacteroidota bacterium]
MHTQSYLPHKALSNLVQAYELYETPVGHASDGQLLFLPGFSQGMLFSFFANKPALIHSGDKGHLALSSEQLVASVTQVNKVSRINNISAIKVSFYPGALSALYQKPLSAFAGLSVSLSEALDPEIAVLRQDLSNLTANTARIDLIEKYLLNKLRGAKRYYPIYPALDEHLRSCGYNHSVPSIARKLALSERDLNRKINQQLGMPLARFRSIHRFNCSLEVLTQNHSMKLTKLAYQMDYSDQPHFNRDFKRFSGFSPAAFCSELKAKKIFSPFPKNNTSGNNIFLHRA